ncbi:hypothetical protein ACHAO4_010293 [Trichoderma viride]
MPVCVAACEGAVSPIGDQETALAADVWQVSSGQWMEGRGWGRGDIQPGGARWVALREAAARWSSGGGPRVRCDGCEATGPAATTREQGEGRMTEAEAECGRGQSTADAFLVMAEGKVAAAWRKVDGTLLADAQ